MNYASVAAAPADGRIDKTPLDNIRALQQPGQPDLLTRIIDSYLEHAVELIEAMRRSLESGDLEVLGRSAHTLKSSAANLGAMQLSSLCRQLASDVAKRRLEDADRLVSEIALENEASAVELRQERVSD